MSDLIDQVKAFLRISEVNRDNKWFKLFSKVAVGACFLGSVVCFSTTYIGDPIVCSHKGVQGISTETIETFCWLHGSYHIDKEFQEQVANGCITENQRDAGTGYYQWVVFMLIIHGLIFALPNAIWKMMERGLMQEFGSTAKSPTIMADKGRLNTTLNTYVDYFQSLRSETTAYTIGFFFCELLNIAATIANFYIANAFLNHKFTTYGYEVVEYFRTDGEALSKPNPMCDAFPTIVSCQFKSVTITGQDDVTNDALCILSQNIINEKIYLGLWFLIIILFVLSGFHMLWRLVLITVPASREFVLTVKCGRGDGKRRHLKKDYLQDYIGRLSLGDWFVLNQISTNCHPLFFTKFIYKLAQSGSSDLLMFNGDIEMHGGGGKLRMEECEDTESADHMMQKPSNVNDC